MWLVTHGQAVPSGDFINTQTHMHRKLRESDTNMCAHTNREVGRAAATQHISLGEGGRVFGVVWLGVGGEIKGEVLG